MNCYQEEKGKLKMSKSTTKKSGFKSLGLSLAIFVGLVLGAIFGLFMPDSLSPVTSFISTVYLHALQMMIYPLVFCSLIVGIKGIGSLRNTGKVSGQSLLYFVCTTIFASFIGLFLPKALGVGSGISIEMAESDITAVEFTSLLDTLKNLIPANPVASFVNGNMLQILVFAIIIGVACVAVGKKADPIVHLCEAINEVAVKIINVIMYTTPIGVFCSIAGTIHANGIDAIIALASVLGLLYLTLAIYVIVVYGIVIVKVIGKFSLKTFFVTVLPAALNAFGTASSSATIPLSKKCTDDMGVPNEISSFALPLGATINMDAVAIVMSFMIVFFANATGTPVSYGLLAIVLLSNALLSIGCPGVPNAAIACFAALSSIAGLPAGVMGMYISVNIMVDAGATCTNVLGDIACSVAMKRTCKLDQVPEEQ